jgi:hypothetical protein
MKREKKKKKKKKRFTINNVTLTEERTWRIWRSSRGSILSIPSATAQKEPLKASEQHAEVAHENAQRHRQLLSR